MMYLRTLLPVWRLLLLECAAQSSSSSAGSGSSSTTIAQTSSTTTATVVPITTTAQTSSTTTTLIPTTTTAQTSSKIVATVAPQASGFSAMGCVIEPSLNGGPSGGRALVGNSGYIPGMTVESCASACNAFSNTYAYMGVEYGNTCFCGNTIQPHTGSTAPSDCNLACTGNATELYSGSTGLYRLNLYANPATGGHPDALTAPSNFSLFTL